MIKLKNETHNTYPYFVHCPGRRELYPEAWLRLESLIEYCEPSPTKNSVENVSVITWNSSQSKSILERSCDHFGIKYCSLGKGLCPWSNMMKLSCSLDFAHKCKTKYMLGIDGYDAVVVRCLDPDLEKILERKRARIVFNSTYLESFPYISGLYPPGYKLNRLNAGAWFGETYFIKSFFSYCLNLRESNHPIYKNVISTKMKHSPINSDQTLIKVAGADFIEDIALDDNCEVFNLLGNVRSPNNKISF